MFALPVVIADSPGEAAAFAAEIRVVRIGSVPRLDLPQCSPSSARRSRHFLKR